MATGNLERREVVRQACELGERILKDIHDTQEHQRDRQNKGLTLALWVSSPLRPQLIADCHSLLFYKMTKTACLAGVTRGSGFVISRLPSPHPTLIHWSAPCFVTISLNSLGLSLGRRTVSSFTACMTKDTQKQLMAEGRIREAGFEIAIASGGLQDRAELIGGSCTGGMSGTVGVNKVSGFIIDLCFAGGSLRVDESKNEAAYGAGANAASILGGKFDAPFEMQPLYSAINSIVNVVERVSCPSRVSASLDRITAGFDPERRMVLNSGAVIKEEGCDPSAHARPSLTPSRTSIGGDSVSHPTPSRVSAAAGSVSSTGAAANGSGAGGASSGGGGNGVGAASAPSPSLEALSDEQLEAELQRRKAAAAAAASAGSGAQ